MAKFDVQVFRVVKQTAYLEVEATNENNALEVAQSMLNDEQSIDWDDIADHLQKPAWAEEATEI
jgi:hypothetical protein